MADFRAKFLFCPLFEPDLSAYATEKYRSFVGAYSALAIATGLTLRAVFCLALRQTEGLIGSIIRLLGLDLAIPDHSTLIRHEGVP